MAGAPHDILVEALKEKPELLSELLRRVRGAGLPGPVVPVDSSVRFAVSLETYPDLVLATLGPDSTWFMVEVQNRKDERKARSWYLATGVLLQRHRMGDLVVITASRAVARWASSVAMHEGALGTRAGVAPVVLHLSKKEMDRLLDPAAPELALFAVWARCRGNGPEAKRVARRALEVTEALPPELQEAQTRAILVMLGERLLGSLREMAMDVNKIPETKASRAFRLFFENRGICEGARNTLLAVLAARGFTPSPAQMEQLAAVDDPELLGSIAGLAVTAATIEEALAPLHARPQPRRAGSGRAPRAGRRPPRPACTRKSSNGHEQ